MAERLDMPSTISERVALIENTEWATSPHFRGRGLGSIVVKALNQEVEADMVEMPHLSIAECNIISGAHVVAHKVGYTAPETRVGDAFIPQVLVQNVRVGDGLDSSNIYRDFAFLTLQK